MKPTNTWGTQGSLSSHSSSSSSSKRSFNVPPQFIVLAASPGELLALGCNLWTHLSLQISRRKFVQQLRKVIDFQFIYLFLVRMGVTFSKLFTRQNGNCNILNSKLVTLLKVNVSIPLTPSFHIKTHMCVLKVHV